MVNFLFHHLTEAVTLREREIWLISTAAVFYLLTAERTRERINLLQS